MATVLWTGEFPYRSGTVRVERLPTAWRLTLASGKSADRRTLVEAFETLLGCNAAHDEVAVVLNALASAQAAAPADMALTRELESLDPLESFAPSPH